MSDGRTLALGLDVGGSNARITLVDGEHVVADRGFVTGRGRAEAIVAGLVAAMRELVSAAAPDAVSCAGIGVAGQVDLARGVVHFAPNLDWHEFPLRQRVSDAVSLPVAVLNDVQAAAYGEWSYGAARGAPDAIALFVGTGVGGGIISNGELVRGCSGSAGELGHTLVSLAGPQCRCGARGCLEAYAGGWAIAQRAQQAIRSREADASRLLALARGETEAITAELVAAAAAEGDALAGEIVRDAARALGASIASMLNALNPCAVVLGGGVFEGLPEVAALAETEARARALPSAVGNLRVVPAALGGFAGAIGAAAWARHMLERSAAPRWQSSP